MNKARNTPNGKQEKPKDIKYVLRRLWNYMCYFKGQLIICIILTILSNVFALIGPRLSGLAIDAIELGKGKVNFQLVFKYAILMVIFYVLSSVFC